MMKRLMMLVLAGGLFFCAGDMYAQCSKAAGKACCAAKSKPALTEAKTVTRDEVASFIQAGNVTILDARDENSFNAGHVPGAVNLASAGLPADKNAKIVFYCGGTFCSAAPKAAKEAIKAGYKNVMVFRGGWAEWSKGQS